MEEKSLNLQLNMKVVRCPKCKHKLLDIESGRKPFKPSATKVAINLKCNRCGNLVEIILENI